MHDIIHRELQTMRVADFHRRARQDRLERDAARQLRRRVLGRVLGFLMARRSGLRQFAAQARTSSARAPGAAQFAGRR
jgi:hypothetical protein